MQCSPHEVRAQSTDSRLLPHLPDHLLSILLTEFVESHRACELFDDFLPCTAYQRSLVLKLLDVAKGATGDPWEVRRLAILMLEHQVLKLSTNQAEEFDFLLTQLNLKATTGVHLNVNDSVLREGYTTTELGGFIVELRRKLERLKWVHDKIRGRRTSKAGSRAFVHLSQQDCKLSLARYLFTPEEVANQITRQVKLTEGVISLTPAHHPYTEEESAHVLSHLPDFENKILCLLRDASKILWVTDTTSSQLNSLVEYPLTTVVLVVKPPGSHVEFEIKRAGNRDAHALSVVFRRNGTGVPSHHRFHGGSMQYLLRWEAAGAAFFSKIYRLVHGTEAPLSRTICISTIYNVPVRDADEHILEYFTRPQIFGEGFEQMRQAMKESVDAFQREKGGKSLPLSGDLGLTLQFLSHVGPGQAILCGTSSFRLDRLAKYLSSEGPKIYFQQGLQVKYTHQDAQRLADDVLEEVLGIYLPPEVRYRGHEHYVQAALAVPENRTRADRNFLSVMQDIGTFWGTLLAVRGYTRGESVVARNVGLRSVWDEGEWKVKIIFMDNDDMHLVGKGEKDFHPLSILPSTRQDEIQLVGGPCGQHWAAGDVGLLENIYRIGHAIRQESQAVLRQAMAHAYRKTHDALESNPELQRLFHKRFVKRIRDWDTMVGNYLQIRHDPPAVDAWKAQTREVLTQKGYEKTLINEHLRAIELYAEFLQRWSFLF